LKDHKEQTQQSQRILTHPFQKKVSIDLALTLISHPFPSNSFTGGSVPFKKKLNVTFKERRKEKPRAAKHVNYKKNLMLTLTLGLEKPVGKIMYPFARMTFY